MLPSKAKYFAQQLGSLASLYLSLGFFLGLTFGLINLLLPDASDTAWQAESYQNAIRVGFAMTIVFFPTYLWLTRLVNQCRRLDDGCAYLGITKWLIYLSLLIAGGAFLITLVTTIVFWLQGDVTLRFLLKVLAVLVVSGSVFSYYRMDALGYWMTRPWASIFCGTVASIIILLTLIFAVSFIDSPSEAREHRLDDEQIEDLRVWQWRIKDYLLSNERLPEGIGIAFAGEPVPSSPEGRAAYRYELTGTGFNLCAEFYDTASERNFPMRPLFNDSEGPRIQNGEQWYYEAGNWCFERTVEF